MSSCNGIRMGEGLALPWLNLNAAERELAITHTHYKGQIRPPKTSTSQGRLRLPPVIVGLLEAHRERPSFREDSDFNFCRPSGVPLCKEVVRAHLYKAMDDVGIERQPHRFGFHVFRHSAAALLFDLPGNLEQVQSALRHADKATTKIYVHYGASGD